MPSLTNNLLVYIFNSVIMTTKWGINRVLLIFDIMKNIGIQYIHSVKTHYPAIGNTNVFIALLIN